MLENIISIQSVPTSPVGPNSRDSTPPSSRQPQLGWCNPPPSSRPQLNSGDATLCPVSPNSGDATLCPVGPNSGDATLLRSHPYSGNATLRHSDLYSDPNYQPMDTKINYPFLAPSIQNHDYVSQYLFMQASNDYSNINYVSSCLLG